MKLQLSTAMLVISLVTASAAMAAGANVSSGSVSFSADAAGTLTVSGPEGFHHSQAIDASGAIFDLFDADGAPLADGSYSWQITLDGQAPEERSGVAAKGDSASGSFSIKGGAAVNPLVLENTKDNVIIDDLIVEGSACVGIDCANGENFGFDTLRLKENNLRIKFDDTSASASFPGNDWMLTANESDNGGLNKFSIDDVTGGKTPMTIEAGAPNHSLYVDDAGKLGIGTSTPAVNAHITEGNTPTLRLEQDGSSGFTPQSWDLAGNETNFFIRDVTNGSKLPFRIKPGAPTDSLYVKDDGNVGLGTDSPQADLDVKADTPAIRLTGNGATQAENWEMKLNNSGNLNFQRQSDGVNLLSLRQSGNIIQLAAQATAPATCALGEMYVDDSGALCFCGPANVWSVAAGSGTCQ